MYRSIHVTVVLGLIWCAALMVSVARAQSSEVTKQITAAAPATPCAKLQKPRKLLVFTLCRGFRHASIDVGAEAMKILGEKTGAFETVESDDISMFEPETLRPFDAVCMLNTTGELFLPPKLDELPPAEQEQARQRDARLKRSLLEFIEGGKGLVGIHAATDCFYKWPEYGELIGGYFNGHPWHEHVVLKLDDPNHPICAPFDGSTFEVKDEIYQFRDPYSRKRQRVLLSLDTTRTDMNKKGIHRDDNDFAVSWVSSYGKGRVFYCSLGHRDEIFWNSKVLRHFLAGIQFAMGDLPADTTPSATPGTASSIAPITMPGGEPLASGWTSLFNGKDLTGWQCKEGSWVAEDGVLTRVGGGDIWSKEQFGDFMLELEFKVDKGTNSGVFFRTADIKDCVQTGIEMQVLDSYGKTGPGKHDCGAIYDCLAPAVNAVKKPGEWNHVVLICHGSRVKADMNGERIIDMNLDDWTEPNKNPDGTKNKFRTAYKDMPRIGHIGFQDHGKPVWYRNIRIKRLGK